MTETSSTQEHRSADGYPVEVGKHFWTNDLRVAVITELGTRPQLWQGGPETQTWHEHTDGISDTMTGSLQRFGRLARYFEGKDAEQFPAGTNYSEVKYKLL